MKKIFLMTFVAAITFLSYGQKNEVNSAYNAYQNGYLDRAKTAIDKAVLNEFTKTEARTWMYYGNIYIRLADANNNEKSSDKEFKGLCSNCTEMAYEAYRKAFELDPNITVTNMGISTPQQGLGFCAHYLYEDAFKKYQEKQYEDAFLLAEKASKADASKTYITVFYAMMAEMTKRPDIAKTNYNSLISRDVKDMKAAEKDPERLKKLRKSRDIAPYLHLVNIYKAENDTTNMLRVLEAGAPIFFSEDSIYANFATAYSIGLSWTGKSEKASEVMDKALSMYPNNYVLLINYGSELSNAEKYNEAEKYFKRAVELQPNEVITVYNLGSCYYNNYAQRINALNDVDDDDLYKKGKEEADKLLESAQPYLEKAHQLDSKDRNTLIMLKQIYANLGKTEELKAVEAKLGAL
jgi:tetratricopeptide (TPR) repeat protein